MYESVVPLPEQSIPHESRRTFRHGLRRLLGINAVSFGLSLTNELVVGHSAMGFSQVSMEGLDSGLAVGLHASEVQDVKGRIQKASRIRQGLYGLHIGVAGVGMVEAMRIIEDGSQPSAANIAISGVVGVLNANFIYHRIRHHKHTAHTDVPTYDTAMNDPIEVVQDELHNRPSAEAVHKMNDNGTTAIAWTNVAESVGGMSGAGLQIVFEQGGAVATIASGAAVCAIMAQQIVRERALMSRFK